jgi:hypothetical protein
VNVWAGIIGSHLLGLCILPHRLNHQNFLNFLNNDFVNLLEDIPLAILRNMWLQLDGATPHFAILVRTWLNKSYPNRSTGRGGGVASKVSWLNSNGWGQMCGETHQTVPETVEILIDRINAAAATVTVEMLENVQLNLNGHNFEHLL